jgi:hypothetical protein
MDAKQRRKFKRAVARGITEQSLPHTIHQSMQETKTIGDKLLAFFEHGWVLTVLGVILPILSVRYIPVLFGCAILIAVAFHRVGVVKGRSVLKVQTPAYVTVCIVSTGLLYLAGLTIESNLPPTLAEITNAIISGTRPKHVYVLDQVKRTHFEDAIKGQSQKGVIRIGCDNDSESSCLAAADFLLTISEAGWPIDSKKVFRLQQAIPKAGIAIASNDPDAAKYPSLPAYQGFWHKMTPTETSFWWAFRALGIAISGTNDLSLAHDETGIYFGPEPIP